MSGFIVTMTDVNGVEHVLADAEEGVSLMELAKRNGVEGILGDCGGGCSCATCHVYVDAAWWDRVGEPDDIEGDLLDMVADVKGDHSRLGCQIKMRPELDGLAVTVAPPSDY
ncbi:MAG TPA: 2Fe-2S iron-sulfur cluster-binding protein [Novosphingobium sp.]